jgi:mannonate dehydratase
MKIGVRTGDGSERRLIQSEQVGAQGGSIWASSAWPNFAARFVPTRDEILRTRERFEAHHQMLTGIGLGAECLQAQLLGLPERDREIEKVCETLRVIGAAYKDLPAADSPVIILDQRVTYWVHDGWTGTARIPGRGGVLLHDFDITRDAHLIDAPAGQVGLDEVWERIAYLYERIVPVAAEADIRLATHPDDPPLAVYRGAAQAFNSLAGFKRLFDMFPNPYNGMLLCLGCMQEAGEDVVEVIRDLGQRRRIFYVHFRNVKGRVPHYTEVFPNEGDYDTVAALRAFWEVGYDGILCPDHQFGILGDDDWSTISQAWQVGYLTALLQATMP